MAPSLFGVDPYAYVLVIAALIGVMTSILLARTWGASAVRVAMFEVAMAIAAFAGAKFYSMAMGQAVWWPSWDAIRVGGFRYPGGMLAAIVAFPLLSRICAPTVSRAFLADAMASGAAFAMAVARIGCLLEGCCFGPVSSVPWAVRFPSGSPAWTYHASVGLIAVDAPMSLPVHPLEVYFGLWSLGTGILLVVMRRSPAYHGKLLPWFLFVHETGKGILESLRRPATLWYLQGTSLGVALAAAVVLVWARGRASGDERLTGAADRPNARSRVAGAVNEGEVDPPLVGRIRLKG